MRILIFDIETCFDVAAVWNAWKQNIAPSQVLQEGRILSYAAKWYGEDEVIYDEAFDLTQQAERNLLKSFAKLARKADVVVAHNGDNFDLKWIRTQMISHGLKPLAPVKSIDTLKLAKQQFRFRHNRLDFIAKKLGCTPKAQHSKFPGHELWDQVYKGNPEARREMLEYNIQDVLTLEEVFTKLQPWTRGGVPNMGVKENSDSLVCPKCGGKHLHKRGYTYTTVSKFQRYRCNSCGGWSRGRTNLLTQSGRKNVLAHIS